MRENSLKLLQKLRETKAVVNTGKVQSVDAIGRIAVVRFGGGASGAKVRISTQALADLIDSKVRAGEQPTVRIENDLIVDYETGSATPVTQTSVIISGVDVVTLNADYYAHILDEDAHHNAFTGLEDTADTPVAPNANNRIKVAGSGAISVVAGTNILTVSGATGDGLTTVANEFVVDQAFAFTWTGVSTFNPAAPGAPFLIGANGVGQTVVGLKADTLNQSIGAGNGLLGGGALTGTVNVSVGAGNGILSNADDVAVDQAYAFNWTGNHTFHNVEPATNNTYTNGTTLKRWSDVFTTDFNATGDAIINGTVTVDTAIYTDVLQATGSVLVSGDFTVGANVLAVNTAGQRIGINRTADAQFALDVSGNTRTSGYFVGKHAIQLENALLISHFDGKQPFQTDFTGSAISHRGHQATITGGAIYRPGRFDKAIQIAEATTNLWTNPVLNSATTGITRTGGTSFTRITTEAYIGIACGQLDTTGSNATLGQNMAVTSGSSYALSVYVKKTNGAAVTSADIDSFKVGAVTSTGYTITVAERGWYRVTAVLVAGTTATVEVGFTFDSGRTLYVDGFQVEVKTYVTPLAVGDMGTGYAWTGTAHASTTTRTAARLEYDPSAFMKNGPRTIGFWFKTGLNDGAVTLFAANGALNWSVDVDLTGSLSLTVDGSLGATAAGTVLPNVWYFLVATTDETNHTVFLNGVEVLTGIEATQFPITTLSIGSSTSINQLNGLIDDFFILDSEASDDLIRTIYESGSPVFAETANWSFQTPNTLAYADEFGLWAINDTGAAAFGVSGVDARSWGGQTLDKGDVLLGNGTSYAKWDASSGTFSVAGAITAQSGSIDGFLTLGTGGGIYQGTGTSGSPTTGLKLYRSGSIGLLEGYSGGVLQAGFNSSGALSAGAGNVLLNANGIRLNAAGGKFSSASIEWYESAVRKFSLGTRVDLGSVTAAYLNTPLELSIESTSDVYITATSLTLGSTPFSTTGTVATGNTTVTGTLGVSGTSTIAALSATSGTFSTTLGVTGVATFNSFIATGGTSFPVSPANNYLYYRTDYRAWFQYQTSITTWHQVSVGSFTGAFPTSPAPVDNLIVYRYDRDIEYFYNSATSQWLSTEIFIAPVAEVRVLAPYTTAAFGASDAVSLVFAIDNRTYGARILDTYIYYGLGATNSGTHYWHYRMNYDSNDGGATQDIMGTAATPLNTSAMAASATGVTAGTAINISTNAKGGRVAVFHRTTGAPTAATFRPEVRYRYIG